MAFAKKETDEERKVRLEAAAKLKNELLEMDKITDITEVASEPGELDVSKIKFDEDGNIDCNLLFQAKQADYKIVLFPAIRQMNAGGGSDVLAAPVSATFRGGRFILDDMFRNAHYVAREGKVSDTHVLHKLITNPEYKKDFWFSVKLTNEEAEKQSRLLDRLIGKFQTPAPRDELAKRVLEQMKKQKAKPQAL